MTRTLAMVATASLSIIALAACGSGGDSATGAETLKSVRAQIAKAQEEQAVCAEMIETERTNIEVAEELGRPTHNFELLLTTDEKCLERERLKEVNLREQEGKLEEQEVGNLSEAEYDERQAKCEREWVHLHREEKYPPKDPAAAAEETCLEWREEDEALGE